MVVLLVQDRFDFQRNGHLFADHDTAALEDSVSAHAEVGPVDIGRRAEARTGAAIRIRAEPTELQFEGHGLGDATDGELTVEQKVPPSGRSPVEVNVIFGCVATSKKLLLRRSSSRILVPVSMDAISTSPSACESSTFSAVTMFPVNSVNLPRIFDTIRCRTVNVTSECTGSIFQVPTTYPGIIVMAAVIRIPLQNSGC